MTKRTTQDLILCVDASIETVPENLISKMVELVDDPSYFLCHAAVGCLATWWFKIAYIQYMLYMQYLQYLMICSFNKSVSFSHQTEQRIKEEEVEAHFWKASKLSLSGENTFKTSFKVDWGSPFPNCCYLNDFWTGWFPILDRPNNLGSCLKHRNNMEI